MHEPIMIIEKESAQLHSAKSCIEKKLHHETIAVQTVEEALRWLLTSKQRQPELILMDISNGESIDRMRDIQELRVYRPQLAILALIAYGDEERASLALRAGANGLLTKPVMLEQLSISIRNILAMQQMHHVIDSFDRRYHSTQKTSDMLGNSSAMQKLRDTASQLAAYSSPAWIEGGAGSGKELFARVLHGESARAGKGFLAVDGATTTEDKLRELLLTPGSLAGGTLYVRDAGALNPAAQHALESYIGASPPAPESIRILCGSNMPPAATVSQHSLYLTLKRVAHFQHVVIPPLDERKADIPVLANCFLQRYAAKDHKHTFGIHEDALLYLGEQTWAGNVRQLCRLLRRTIIISDHDVLTVEDIRQAQYCEPVRQMSGPMSAPLMLDTTGRIKTLRAIEEDAIRFALRYSSGCMTRAARNLGIGRSTLYRRLQEMESKTGDHISRANQTIRPIMKVSASDRS